MLARTNFTGDNYRTLAIAPSGQASTQYVLLALGCTSA